MSRIANNNAIARRGTRQLCGVRRIARQVNSENVA
jgi:hypothetical protein